jgi:YidC/Oxa1 family membrane protein insertase
MERSSTLKWVLLALAAFLFYKVGWPTLFGSKEPQRQPLTIDDAAAPAETARGKEELCSIVGPRFQAELSTRGASLRHFRLSDAKYASSTDPGAAPIDLVTTSREARMPLRTDLRLPGAANQQVDFDDFDWKLESKSPERCVFTAKSDTSVVTKTIEATDRAFELAVTTTITNLADAPRKHRYAIEQSSWRTVKETEGRLGRQSEFMTKTELLAGEKPIRHVPTDFEPEDFKDKDFTAEKWRQAAGAGRWSAVSSSYFASAVIHLEAPANASAEDQIEEYWNVSRYPNKSADPDHGFVYRARLAYPEHTLAPKASVTYRSLSFMGPKERVVLAQIGGGSHATTDLLDLGWFSVIGKALVQYVYVLQHLMGSWGWAICLLTISVKLLLFPLSIAQIRSSAAMRQLKPEMDEINAKYKDDATQRGLALQELWRKNKVANPVAGCVPLLLQMPVWFALYTALQTAVELYHVPFGPFIPDLSAPGKYYIIPIVLGGSSLVQQRLMPPQGDPAQQKMMMYLMPGMFTVMMLFLPAGLGVYMLTNTWLGITQQLLVERYLKTRQGVGIVVTEKNSGDDDSPPSGSPPALGKGKAKPRG